MKTLYALAPLAALAIAGCASTAPAPVAKGQVTGSVLYRERIMLPPTATVTVSLADTSLMDAPAKIIDTQVLTGGSPPYKFTLNYDPAQIVANHTYTVSARIEVDGKLRFITDTHTPVITRGAPNHVEMIAVGVPQN
ncbi:putative lipoprotein [Phenylobacterium haematophilum]|uniref:Putative lipoprotein n=1 Tax=Phenylobacterium haematophilum TaxID=98513 RepID=A0A840A166_9CAUL|nr:YbaY family lipoprotein [Phenylobacterium haematophilum]MBB3891210.1 putative lipoprotein [Phenylobacterium haematophilum]